MVRARPDRSGARRGDCPSVRRGFLLLSGLDHDDDDGGPEGSSRLPVDVRVLEERARRKGRAWPSSSGLQFSLSESLPDTATSVVVVVVVVLILSEGGARAVLWMLCLWVGAMVLSILAMPLNDLLSFVLLTAPGRLAGLPTGAFRFARLLFCSRGLPLVALVDLSKLIMAVAEPVFSRLACTVNASSRFFETAMYSQEWTLWARPRVRGGGSPLAKSEKGCWQMDELRRR